MADADVDIGWLDTDADPARPRSAGEHYDLLDDAITMKPDTDAVRALEAEVVAPEDETAIKFVTVHGHRRAYRMMGEGPPVLLLHGIGDSSRGWRPLMPALAEHYTVIAPDLLGHGESAKPRADYSVAAYANGMRDLLEILGVERATIVGHSLGGGVAAQLAYQYPGRCERLVLVATGGVSREVSPILRIAAAPFAELSLPVVHLSPTRIGVVAALQVLKRIGSDLGKDADEVNRVLRGLPTGEARSAFTHTLRSVVDWRGQIVTMLDRSYLVDDIPLLVMWGDRDSIIPVAHAYKVQEALPGAQLEIFPGAGHFPHHADPDRFIELLHTFITTTEPRPHERTAWRARLREGRPGHPSGYVVPDDDRATAAPAPSDRSVTTAPYTAPTPASSDASLIDAPGPTG